MGLGDPPVGEAACRRLEPTEDAAWTDGDGAAIGEAEADVGGVQGRLPMGLE